MPGIENFAPERTETSSGFVDRPELRAGRLLEPAQVLVHLLLDGGRHLASLLVVEVAGGRRDREARRHRQAGVGHLGQARSPCRRGCPSSCGCRRPCRRRRSTRTAAAAGLRAAAAFAARCFACGFLSTAAALLSRAVVFAIALTPVSGLVADRTECRSTGSADRLCRSPSAGARGAVHEVEALRGTISEMSASSSSSSCRRHTSVSRCPRSASSSTITNTSVKNRSTTGRKPDASRNAAG